MARFTRRMSAEARKRQIVEVTLDLISEYGLHGATMSRIAAGVGVTQASLYTHFDSRQSILLAALDTMYERIYADREALVTENSLDTLRRICEHHRKLWTGQEDRRLYQLLLAFIAGARAEGLQEALAEKHLATVGQLAEIVEDGKREGRIPEHVNADQVAWLITGWTLGGDFCDLIGFSSVSEANVSTYWHAAVLDLMFADFVRGRDATPAGDSPVLVDI